MTWALEGCLRGLDPRSAVLLAAIAASSCSRHYTALRENEIETSAEMDAGVEPLSAETFAPRVAEAVCAGAVGCCALAGELHDEQACRLQLEARLETVRKTLEARGYVYRPAQATQCLDELSRTAEACTGDWFSGDTCGYSCSAPAQHVACATTFSGDAEEGDDCELSADCSPSSGDLAYCDGESKTCVLARRGAEIGDPCIGACADAQCVIEAPHPRRSGDGLCDVAQGAYCDRRERICTPAPSIGEHCETGAGLSMPDRLEVDSGLCQSGATPVFGNYVLLPAKCLPA